MKKPSGPALFMYSVIVLTVLVSLACFVPYYGGKTDSGIVPLLFK